MSDIITGSFAGELILRTAQSILILQVSRSLERENVTQTLRQAPREFRGLPLRPRPVVCVNLPYRVTFQFILNHSFEFRCSSPTDRILQVKHTFYLKIILFRSK